MKTKFSFKWIVENQISPWNKSVITLNAVCLGALKMLHYDFWSLSFLGNKVKQKIALKWKTNPAAPERLTREYFYGCVLFWFFNTVFCQLDIFPSYIFLLTVQHFLVGKHSLGMFLMGCFRWSAVLKVKAQLVGCSKVL